MADDGHDGTNQPPRAPLGDLSFRPVARMPPEFRPPWVDRAALAVQVIAALGMVTALILAVAGAVLLGQVNSGDATISRGTFTSDLTFTFTVDPPSFGSDDEGPTGTAAPEEDLGAPEAEAPVPAETPAAGDEQPADDGAGTDSTATATPGGSAPADEGTAAQDDGTAAGDDTWDDTGDDGELIQPDPWPDDGVAAQDPVLLPVVTIALSLAAFAVGMLALFTFADGVRQGRPFKRESVTWVRRAGLWLAVTAVAGPVLDFAWEGLTALQAGVPTVLTITLPLWQLGLGLGLVLAALAFAYGARIEPPAATPPIVSPAIEPPAAHAPVIVQVTPGSPAPGDPPDSPPQPQAGPTAP